MTTGASQTAIPDDRLFDLRKEQMTSSMQRQYEYGKWLLASLLAAHLGSLLAISQAEQAAAKLFAAAGFYLIMGVGTALCAGGLAWINFTVAAVVYYKLLESLVTGEPRPVTTAVRITIGITLFGAAMCVAASLMLFFVAATTAIETLQDPTTTVTTDAPGWFRNVIISGSLPYLSIAFSVVAASLGIRAATVEVRNSQDDFIDDLKRQGRWASWAAVAAAASVVLQSLDRLLS